MFQLSLADSFARGFAVEREPYGGLVGAAVQVVGNVVVAPVDREAGDRSFFGKHQLIPFPSDVDLDDIAVRQLRKPRSHKIDMSYRLGTYNSTLISGHDPAGGSTRGPVA